MAGGAYGLKGDFHWSLKDRLGSGGFGDVWRAVRREDGAVAAVKLFSAAAGPGDVVARRFDYEIELVKKLADLPGGQHRLQVLDEGSLADGRRWFAMTYIEGEHLGVYLKELRRLPPSGPRRVRWVAQVGGQLAAVVAQLHHMGFVHRDLKPENVIMPTPDAPVLVDFGAAIDTREMDRTTVAMPMFTPVYLAPDLMLRGPSGASDVYALGVMLAEMAVGRRVLEPAEVSGLVSSVRDEALGDLIRRMTAPAGRARPSMAQVAGGLEGLGGGPGRAAEGHARRTAADASRRGAPAGARSGGSDRAGRGGLGAADAWGEGAPPPGASAGDRPGGSGRAGGGLGRDAGGGWGGGAPPSGASAGRSGGADRGGSGRGGGLAGGGDAGGWDASSSPADEVPGGGSGGGYASGAPRRRRRWPWMLLLLVGLLALGCVGLCGGLPGSQAAWQLLTSGMRQAAPTCGDGVLQSWEECDDGNTDDGDGCSSVCTWEAVAAFPTAPAAAGGQAGAGGAGSGSAVGGAQGTGGANAGSGAAGGSGVGSSGSGPSPAGSASTATAPAPSGALAPSAATAPASSGAAAGTPTTTGTTSGSASMARSTPAPSGDAGVAAPTAASSGPGGASSAPSAPSSGPTGGVASSGPAGGSAPGSSAPVSAAVSTDPTSGGGLPANDAELRARVKALEAANDGHGFGALLRDLGDDPTALKAYSGAALLDLIRVGARAFDRAAVPGPDLVAAVAQRAPASGVSCEEGHLWLAWARPGMAGVDGTAIGPLWRSVCGRCTQANPEREDAATPSACRRVPDYVFVNGRCVHKHNQLYVSGCGG